jgi:predicted alternative tryptophan synthase beta-subunit
LGKLTKRLSALTKDAFVKTVKKIRNNLIFNLQKQWYDAIYKRLSVQYTFSGSRNSVGGISYPFMRTRTLRESLALLKPKGKFTFTKDSYHYNFKIIGKLGPASKNGFDYADYINKNTIVKGYRDHAFKSLGIIIDENLNKMIGK